MPIDTLANTAFFGPYALREGKRTRHLYTTLAHWFDSHRFLPHRPDLHDLVLDLPTKREREKFLRSHQRFQRTDWMLVRHSTLVVGVATLLLDRYPTEVLEGIPLDGIEAALEHTGCPAKFIKECVPKLEAWLQGPAVSVLGASEAPSVMVGRRMDKKLTPPLPLWTLVSTCNRRASWNVHDWALTHHVPIVYVGKADDRQSRRLSQALIERSTHLICFDKRDNRQHERWTSLAKSLGKKVSVDYWDADAEAEGSLWADSPSSGELF